MTIFGEVFLFSWTVTSFRSSKLGGQGACFYPSEKSDRKRKLMVQNQHFVRSEVDVAIMVNV